MRVLAAGSPIYAHTVNATPFLAGLAARGVEVHQAVAAPLLDVVPPGVAAWDTGPVRPFGPGGGGRVAEVARRYSWLVDDAADRVVAVRRLIEDLRPDLVLTDSLGYAAALAAEQAGLPWVSFGDGPLHYPDRRTPPFGAGLPYRTPAPWVWRNVVVQTASRHVVMAAPQRRYARLRAALGLPPRDVPVLEACLSPTLHLHCGVPELEYPRDRLPDHVRFVGALRPSEPTGWAAPAWWGPVVEEHHGEVVLATQGTLRGDSAEVLRPALRLLLDTGRAGVLTTGAADPAPLAALAGASAVSARAGGGPSAGGGAAGDGAATAVAVERFVPYARVLPHAGVFVTNGGWTGVLLALAHGVPVVQVGRTEEKADIGRRVEWAGAGLHVPGAGRDGRRLRRALDAVLTEPRHREGAQRLAASLAAHDPPREGADLIMALQA